jgi:hypothetical protein
VSSMTQRGMAITRALGSAMVLLLVLSACGVTDAPAADKSPGQGAGAPPTPMAGESIPEDCINPPRDVSTLIEQDRPAACYGSADLTVEAHATLVVGVVDCPGTLEPAWLGCGGQQVELFALEQAGRLPEFLLVARSRGPSLWAVIHPDSGIDLHRGLDAPVRAIGHFDDPAAQACRYTEWQLEEPPPPAEVIDGCRSRFVITQLELLDPSEVDGGATDEPAASGALAPHDIAQVLTTDLVVRSAPGVGADSAIYEWQLDAPTLLYVFDGPITSDGYDWYQVMPSRVDYLPSPYGVGWVAAGSRDGEAWIGPAAADCPPPTVGQIAALSGLGALACFGNSQLELEGDLGGCAARDPALSPAEPWPTRCWLSPFDCCPDVVPYPSGITVWNEAVLAHPSDAQPARVIGHFDDPAAAGCADVAPDGAGTVPTGWGTFVCRTSFVVDEVMSAGASPG